MDESNFERLVGQALSNKEFAEKLKKAIEKIKNDQAEGEKAFQDVLKEEFGEEWPMDEVDKIIEAIHTIDLEAISRVATVFGDDTRAN